MTAEAHRPRTTLPTASVLELAQLLTDADEFLRSSPAVASELEHFLARRGHRFPGFAASNFIDDVSFTALWLRNLTSGKAGRRPRPDTGPG
jgi:hypothetical protein